MQPPSPENEEVRPPVVTRAPPREKQFPCLKCGARLEFDPSARALTCPYCGHAEVLEPGNKDLLERDLERHLNKVTGIQAIAGRPREVRCAACGAVTLLDEAIRTESCPYCASHLENEPEAAQDMIEPEGILPFAVDQRTALASFDRWLHGLWFAPGTLRKFANLGRLNGYYVPFWTYDSMTYTFYRGERGDDYYATETYTDRESYTDSSGRRQSRSVTKTRQVRKTRWRSVSGEVRHFFDDVLIPASTSLPSWYTSSLTDSELKDLESFRPEFLSGFVTERYTIAANDGFETAKVVMDGKIRALCCADIGGDHQRLHHVDTQHAAVTFKHVLLPVWLAVYRYHDKPYRVMVNGRTGEVVGDRPYSWAKIISLIVLILAIVGTILFFVFSNK